MTRRFALGFGAGLALLCASLASLERIEPAASWAGERDVQEIRKTTREPRDQSGGDVGSRAKRSKREEGARAADLPEPREDRDPRAEAAAPLRARNRAVSAVSPLELHPAASAGGAIRFVGFDPDAPRALWLWRIRDEQAAVVARTRSEPDGTFAFSPLLVPATGLAVVATPAGAKAGAPEASRLRRLAARTPRAPRGVARDGAHGDWHVRVTPVEAAGAVLIATADEQVIGRFALPELPGAPPRAFDLSVVPDMGDESLWLAHELPDGRRSAWRPVDWAGFEEGDEQ
jgi:hypothetical protein